MPTSSEQLEDILWETRHEWVRWLMGEDAQTLLWQLCEWIDDPTISRDGLSARVNAWHKNARKAVGAQSWTVRVDQHLGICLDQRLYLFDRRMRTWP
jgi:hypothetical protein